MIKPINVYNLDGFNNYRYKNDPFEEIHVQIIALADKLNEVIDLVNMCLTTQSGQEG